MSREKELEKALRRLTDALWDMDLPCEPSKRLNNAYIAATNLLAKINTERLKAKV